MSRATRACAAANTRARADRARDGHDDNPENTKFNPPGGGGASTLLLLLFLRLQRYTRKTLRSRSPGAYLLFRLLLCAGTFIAEQVGKEEKQTETVDGRTRDDRQTLSRTREFLREIGERLRVGHDSEVYFNSQLRIAVHTACLSTSRVQQLLCGSARISVFDLSFARCRVVVHTAVEALPCARTPNSTE